MSHASHNHGVKKLGWILGLTFLYFIAELVGGYLTGSLALLADAGHMFTDVAALSLALFASWFASRAHHTQKTYGFYRLEVMAAFINGLLLAGLACWIVFESVERLVAPHDVAAEGMLWVALGGLVVNIIGIVLLHGDQHENLNVRGAYLHILGDLLGSIGTLVAAGLILTFGWYQADSYVSILIAFLVLISAINLIRESGNILLEASPKRVNIEALQAELESLDGVLSVHDLHVWTIASNRDALTAHVVVQSSAFTPLTLSSLQSVVRDQYDIQHMTVQLETEAFEKTHDDGFALPDAQYSPAARG